MSDRPAPPARPGGSASPTRSGARTILHVDMDAFFVSVELLRRPELRGRPVVVGGTGGRGVVAAASYEARHYGVFSAMPASRARRLCPHAVFLPGDMDHYVEVSQRIMAIFASVTPLVEPLSVDEAFLDVTGARRLLGEGAAIAAALRERVRAEEGLTCSVGVAPTKMLAKMASEEAKPRASRRGPVFGPGVFVIAPGEELAYLHPKPVRTLWGVGPKTHERLDRMGVTTIGDLASMSQARLTAALGDAAGRHLWQLAHGIDHRVVEPDQRPKSIGHEETFPTDLTDRAVLTDHVVRMGDAVADRLRRAQLAGRTVTLKLRYGDFRTITRSTTLAAPVATGPEVVRAAKALLAAQDVEPGVRLLGVSVAGLAEGEIATQLDLFDAAGLEPAGGDAAPTSPSGAGSAPRRTSPPPPAPAAPAVGWQDVTVAIDDIRRRFGSGAIAPASLVGPRGIRTKRKGDQQWGPDQAQPPAPDDADR